MKTWIKKIFGFGLASFLSDFSHEMTISLIPVVLGQFVTPTQVPFILGIISSISDAFASFLRLTAGFISDRISHKKPLIMLGYGMSALFSTLLGFAHSTIGVLVCRMLSFAGSGLREPPRDAFIATIIEQKEYGRAFGLKSAMDTLGSLLGPLVAFVCIGFFSIKTVFVLSCIPGFLAIFAILFFTKDVLVGKKNTRVSSTFWRNFLLLPRSFVIFLCIVFIFDVGCFNKLLLLSRAQEILNVDKNVTMRLVVLLYAIFNITRACSEFIIGLLSDYINRLILLAFFGCGFFAGVALLLITPHASLLYCAFIFVVAAISSAAITTLKKACAADMLPADIRGLGYGTLQASEGFAALISSALIGFVWTTYSPFLCFVYVIVTSLIAMILLLGFAFHRSIVTQK